MARISKKKFNARLYFFAIVVVTLVALAIFVFSLITSGLRYQTFPTSEHGDIKFLGEMQDGVPVNGTVYFPDGSSAEIVSGKDAKDKDDLPTWHLKLNYSNGDKYEGEMVYFLRHGKGKMEYSGGDVYEGDFFFNDMHGEGIYTYLSGDVYEGKFSLNKKNGKGVYQWAAQDDGTFDHYEGEYVDDMRCGEGTYVWADGTRYIGQFASDAKDGKGALYFPDGAYYQGDFVNDTRTGKGLYKWANGDTYEGDFYRGSVTGQGTFSWSENDERLTYTGYFENGKIVLIEEEEDVPSTENIVETDEE